MHWSNTHDHYGLIAIVLHWITALAVTTLFFLGLWMTELDYYDSWYQRGPELHKGMGVLLFLLLLVRISWRGKNPAPQPLGTHWEKRLARITHGLLYGLLLACMICGYLISTADGRPLEVFNWFSLPATLSNLPEQEDIAGEIHEILAYILIGLSSLHALAALKHHFYNRDRTLKRMLSPRNPASPPLE